MKKILVTGCAGFIGQAVAKRLLESGYIVFGWDNLNEYYDVKLKIDRLGTIQSYGNFKFERIDISDSDRVEKILCSEKFDTIIHLAAQAGVRYSIDNPSAYLDSNLAGMLAILEGCRRSSVGHLIYASSSSVYGANEKQPFSTADKTDSPVSLYAATKKANELMAYSYAHLYGIPMVGLRFFTVYGPWGRPDMAYFKFAKAIRSGKSIDIYNDGQMARDFTFIDDIVDGVVNLTRIGPVPVNGGASHRVYNLGNSTPESLMEMVSLLEQKLGCEAVKNFLPMQPGDVVSTYADISDSTRDFGFSPRVSLSDGLAEFARWYDSYYSPIN